MQDMTWHENSVVDASEVTTLHGYNVYVCVRYVRASLSELGTSSLFSILLIIPYLFSQNSTTLGSKLEILSNNLNPIPSATFIKV